MFLKITSAERSVDSRLSQVFSARFIFIPRAFGARSLLKKTSKEILKHPEKKIVRVDLWQVYIGKSLVVVINIMGTEVFNYSKMLFTFFTFL